MSNDTEAAHTAEKDAVIHACPPGDSGVMPCCQRPPFEVPRGDRIATDPALVTCWTGSDPRLIPAGKADS